MRENLWLNLSDGHIGSGRRQWDGSGGTDGALEHYRTTKELNPPSGFPLVVKLGTITPTGADVYSYAEDEDDLVGIAMRQAPSWQCHRSLHRPGPPGAGSASCWLRSALGTSRRAAQGPMGGCGAAVRPG